MTVDVKENSSPDELLEGFKTRYQKILDENKSLSNKINLALSLIIDSNESIGSHV